MSAARAPVPKAPVNEYGGRNLWKIEVRLADREALLKLPA
jgi:hypothetical protein